MNAVAVQDPNKWQVDLLRLTVFTTAPLAAGMLDGWKAVTGNEPESKASKTTIGIHMAEGPYKHARVILNIGPGRIDWLLTPAPSSEDPAPVIGGYAETAQLFLDLIKPWLKEPPVSVIRLAFGAVLRFPVTDKASGYNVLGQLIPSLKIDPENSFDLMYQINRPRHSKIINALKLNRLSKWMVIHFAVVESVSRVKGVGNEHFCRIELDVNTDPEYKPDFTKDSLRLVDELMKLSTEIITHGDIQ
jgi:hypothetical protein